MKKSDSNKKGLSAEEQDDLLTILEKRFEKNNHFVISLYCFRLL